jgi:PAS domain S-box-containing protein
MGMITVISLTDHERLKTALAVEKARTIFQKDLSYRFWTAQVGELYGTLEKQEPTKPAERTGQEPNLLTPDGHPLTLINPGIMTRTIHEIDLKEFGLMIHLCATKPVNVQNLADPWETKALERLSASGVEYYELLPGTDGPILRYIGAMRATKQCMSCHVEQRFRIGELRGGLSVSIPYNQTLASSLRPHQMRSYAVYGSVWLLGLAGIIVVFNTYGTFERRHRETFEELERREQRFRFFFQHAPVAYLVIDQGARIELGNDAASVLTGYDSAELCTLTLKDLVEAADQSKLESQWENLQGLGFLTGTDITLRRKDGSVTLCSLAARLEQGGASEEHRYHCVLRDVTERRRIQAALAQSEARYRLIASNTGDVTMLVRLPSGIVEYTSPSSQRVLGMAPELLTGRHLADCIAPQSLEWLNEDIPQRARAVSGGDHSLLVQTQEVLFQAPNGEVPMEVVSTLMLDEQGAPSHLVAHCRDISARKQYERALNALLIGTAYSTGQEFSQALVQELSTVLGLGYVVLGRISAESPARARTLAYWAVGQMEGNVEFELRDTAVEQVIRNGIQCFGDKVRDRFPEDHLLENLQIRSFLGVPLLGSDANILGFLLAMDPAPKKETPALLGLLTLFAARASTEIERMDAVGALRERERRFRAIVEQGGAGYMRLGADGRYADVNEAWLLMHGYSSKQEALGLHFRDTLAAQDTDEGLRLFERVLSGAKIPSGEFTHRRRDGSIGHHTYSLTPLLDGHRVCGAEGFMIDTSTLRKAQGDAAMLFNEMIDGFSQCEVVCDPQGNCSDYRFLAVNPAFERITGLRAEHVIGHCASEVYDDMEDHWAQRYGKVAMTGEPAIFEDYFKPLGRWFSISAFQTAPGQFAIIFIDVTSRRTAEIKLEYDEAELAAIHEHVPLMLVLLDSERKVRRYNRTAAQFAELTGLNGTPASPGFFLGCFNAMQGDTGCGHGPNCALCPLRSAIQDTLSTGAAHTQEEIPMMLLRGDHLEECILKFSTARVSVGRQSMVLLCMEDVSSLKAAETRMRRQAALLDITRDAICVLGPTSAVEYWNLGAERIFGWKAPEAIGGDWETLVCKHESPEFQEACCRTRDAGEWSGELRAFSRKGEALVLQTRATLVTEETGNPGSILLVCTDITEARRMEHQFLRMQRMDNLGSLTSGIAHDLNNILSPILMSADLLPPLLTSAEHQPLVQMLRDSARRGADIVRQLLVFSRGNETPRRLLDVPLLVTEMSVIVNQTFPRNIKFSHACPDGMWNIMGDNTQIHQVLLNLCVNARDAMPDGGRLALTAENMLLDSTAPTLHPEAHEGPYVLIQVSDTGQGIPPSILEKIFDPFFTTKPAGKGTGLGLSTVMAIVKSHGGFTLVSSKVGTGSDFRVYIPAIVRNEAVSGGSEVPFDLHGKGELILTVDDESSMRQLMSLSLTNNHYEVLLAQDGAECLDLFAKNRNRVSLAFIDMMMPHLDGKLTIECLRQMNPSLPIIAMSGMHEQAEVVEKMKDHGVRFLLKPFTIKKMLALLREALDQRGTT